jgi:hypothetical protein
MTFFGQTAFGKMVIRSINFAVKQCLVKWWFGQKAFGQKNSVKDFSAK